MNAFEWQLPTRIIFGDGKIQSASKYLRGFGKKCFLVTSPSFVNGRQKHWLDLLLGQLTKLNIETKIFSSIEPNPRTSTIDRAAAEAKAFLPRYILALGGGSVMDAAKCIALLCENEGSIYDYAYLGPKQTNRPRKKITKALPIVCIPTIAATSSETDFYAVVTNTDTQKKVTVFGEPLQPALSIIDPVLTYSVSPKQTTYGAVDIMTHVLETYFSSPKPSPIQDRLSEAIVSTIVDSLPKVLINPENVLHRSQLSWCAALALSGVLSGRDGAWPVHAIEHGLSAVTDVAHGCGLAFVLPRLLKYNEQIIPEKIAHFNKTIFRANTTESGLIRFFQEVQAWTTIQEIAGDQQAKIVIEKTIDHTLEVSGIWRQGKEPILENIMNFDLNKNDLESILTQ